MVILDEEDSMAERFVEINACVFLKAQHDSAHIASQAVIIEEAVSPAEGPVMHTPPRCVA